MKQELEKLYNILVLILGESKSGFDGDNFQYQFPCPHCIEKYGIQEARKMNLEVNLQHGMYNCWKCSSEGDNMHGSIIKLIRRYGNDKLVEEYKSILQSIRNSELYKLNFSNNDFNIDTSVIEREELKLPSSTKFFKKGQPYSKWAFKYLQDRGVGWDIIERYNIGYTYKEDEDWKSSFRIIIPSYNTLGELNYWVGRDYLPPRENSFRMKYNNPKVEKKNIIFNEGKIQWDADITLVEGPFDHIVVPNSIPLLGKALNKDYKLYWELLSNSNEHKNTYINVWLDDDAKETTKEVYSLLNHGNLYGKIRIIETPLGKDPSEIYQKYGYKGIVSCLRNTKQLEDYELFF